MLAHSLKKNWLEKKSIIKNNGLNRHTVVTKRCLKWAMFGSFLSQASGILPDSFQPLLAAAWHPLHNLSSYLFLLSTNPIEILSHQSPEQSKTVCQQKTWIPPTALIPPPPHSSCRCCQPWLILQLIQLMNFCLEVLIFFILSRSDGFNSEPYGHLSLKIHNIKFNITVPLVKCTWKLNVKNLI